MVDFRERYDNDVERTRAAIDNKMAAVWTALPGVIQSVDTTKQSVSVQPAIRGVFRDKAGKVQTADIPLLVDVPIVYPSGGGYTLTFPILPGDECLVVFSSRCIDNWWLAGGVQDPADARAHDLSDGFAIVGPRSVPRVLPAVSPDTVQLRSDSGTMFVEIDSLAQTLTLKSPLQIVLDAPQTVLTGNLEVQNAGGSPKTALFNGTIKATQDVIAATVSVAHHQHTGVRSGDETSGTPTGGYS